MTTTRDWLPLRFAEWADTCQTLHLWTQVVGKTRMALEPWVNHSWHVPLYVSARGLSTSAVPCATGRVEIEFDFIEHQLLMRTSDGGSRQLPLVPRSVAAFYREYMRLLRELGIDVRIWTQPVELADAIRFERDEQHASYDAAAAQRFWRVLSEADAVMKRFRSGFVGKASPVHFFWGSFDHAVTRFSGRPAPLHPGGVPNLADRVVQEAYSQEVSSCGFWPGNAQVDAIFYSYAYPEPPGYSAAAMPDGAFYHPELREFVLPYEQVRTAPDPERLLLDFFDRTYAAAADQGQWDRKALERKQGRTATPASP